MIHIDNFDSRKFQVVNSPRSAAAMQELGILHEDLKLKTEEDLKGMFNTEDDKEKEALKKCVEKHLKAHKNLVKKISDRRKEIIETNNEAEKKRKELESIKSQQFKKLEDEKKAILKQLEAEKKKKDDIEKKKKAELEREAKKTTGKSDLDKSSKEPKRIDKRVLSPDVSQVRGQSAITHKSDHQETKHPLILEHELKESSILGYLDKSVHHKDQLDIDLKERTKNDLKHDIKKMKELMKRQKEEILEMAQKRNASAYKNHEDLGNAKTRRIEYLNDLSRNPVTLMKERQQKEMEQIMNYQMALQVNCSKSRPSRSREKTSSRTSTTTWSESRTTKKSFSSTTRRYWTESAN